MFFPLIKPTIASRLGSMESLRGCLALHEFAMALNAHQDAGSQAKSHKRSAAVAHEGQRHADHGEDTTDHPHVDKSIGEED